MTANFLCHLRNSSGNVSGPDRNMFYRRRAEIMRRAVGEVAKVDETNELSYSSGSQRGCFQSPADLSIVAIIPLYNGARWIEQSTQGFSPNAYAR